ncbi:hypothetical protein [Paradevosia shaoguanensis]|uniref:Uncharacterized protein n=1 Tax=Paradevosia shaoguanensis TaxID=1335043 RepID=A0AA41U9X5_9HYPH|nr:hypothetical protein [Paradevosia shaoguanensis]MCF1741347.1 hypothetical protein [Paradevosia shaoguanensis]MCI0125830.1 hypothetical protein [Paradevosia shaoguanensis]
MTAIGIGVSPPIGRRPQLALHVPPGKAALVDKDRRFLIDSNGAVLLGDLR